MTRPGTTNVADPANRALLDALEVYVQQWARQRGYSVMRDDGMSWRRAYSSDSLYLTIRNSRVNPALYTSLTLDALDIWRGDKASILSDIERKLYSIGREFDNQELKMAKVPHTLRGLEDDGIELKFKVPVRYTSPHVNAVFRLDGPEEKAQPVVNEWGEESL